LLLDQVDLLAHPEPYVQIFESSIHIARRITCTDKLTELAGSLRRAAAKNGGRFAAYQSPLKKVPLRSALENPLNCGEDRPGAASYSFNGNLAKKRLKSVTNPARTVLLYEGSGGRLAFRHKDLRKRGPVANVAFDDGHVELIDQKQVDTLKWKP
jgi:hypothetical protein